MKKVAKFTDYDKPACTALNDWLNKNPDVTLVDIKPIISKANTVTIFAIVDIPEKKKEESK